MNYALTSIKLAGGEETVCFDARLTLDGKIIAHVRNSGTGGCNDWHWIDHNAAIPFTAWILAHTTEKFEPEDGWVAQRLDEYEHQKVLMRQSLKKSLFKIDGDVDEYRLLNTTDTEKVKAWLRVKYPTQHPHVFDRTTRLWTLVTPAMKVTA